MTVQLYLVTAIPPYSRYFTTYKQAVSYRKKTPQARDLRMMSEAVPSHITGNLMTMPGRVAAWLNGNQQSEGEEV
jgi:hypothetical protein